MSSNENINIGKYKILKVLGKGAFGSVYKVQDIDGKIYAMKKIEKFKEFKNKDVILKEINILKKLSNIDEDSKITISCKSINLLCYYDYIEHGENMYIIFNYLEDYIEISKLLVQLHNSKYNNKIINIFLDISKGLKTLHDLNILHLDIKPSNLLINAKFNVVLIDYGLSCLLDEKDILSESFCGNKLVGSANYLAPELFYHELGKIGKWSDIFSLGTFFHLLLSNDCCNDTTKHGEPIDICCKPLFARLLKRGMDLNGYIRYKTNPQNYMPIVKDLKSYIRPEFLIIEKYNKIIPLIQNMLDYNIHKRPTIDEVISVLEELKE